MSIKMPQTSNNEMISEHTLRSVIFSLLDILDTIISYDSNDDCDSYLYFGASGTCTCKSSLQKESVNQNRHKCNKTSVYTRHVKSTTVPHASDSLAVIAIQFELNK